MLVTFSSKFYSDITMFGDVAQQLLKLMGHSGTVPGAILSSDVPQALSKLQSAVQDINIDAKPDDPAKVVGLKHRALPLIDLLESAIKTNSDVMWK